MNSYYGATIGGMSIALAATVVAAFLANSAAAEAKVRHSRGVAMVRERAEACRDQHEIVTGLEQTMAPVRTFSSAWQTYAQSMVRQPAEVLRTDVEAIAQRQLGLVTDGAITPPPDRYSFAGVAVPVQRVTLRASGRDLSALLTWLGCVEEKYPLAVIEFCEFNSNVGGNTGLTLRIAQPLQDVSSIRSAVFRLPEDVQTRPAVIGETPWSDYMPAKLKSPRPIGFPRNPLQPAVAADSTRERFTRVGESALATSLEGAVGGRLHSVVRGPVPIINLDGRLFRVGDELVVGAGREKPVREARVQLKEIGKDQLVFHVSGGTPDKPLECDVAYKLPRFFDAR